MDRFVVASYSTPPMRAITGYCIMDVIELKTVARYAAAEHGLDKAYFLAGEDAAARNRGAA